MGCRLWGHTESDTTEVTQQQQQQQQGMTKNLGGRAKLLTASQDSTKLCVCVCVYVCMCVCVLETKLTEQSINTLRI